MECGCSRQTARRSALVGWAEYGYCASRSRFFWGLRLHLVCTLGGCPSPPPFTGATADDRTTLLAMSAADFDLLARHRGRTILTDMQNYGRDFETALAERDLRLLRKARRGEPARAAAHLLKPLRARPSNRSTRRSRGQLDLERHGGRTPTGVLIA